MPPSHHMLKTFRLLDRLYSLPTISHESESAVLESCDSHIKEMLVLLKHQLMQMFSHRPTVCSKCYGPLVPKFTNNVIEPDVSLLCSGCETSVMCDKVKPLKCGKRKFFPQILRNL